MSSSGFRFLRGTTSLALVASLVAAMLPSHPRVARAEFRASDLKPVEQLREEAVRYDRAIAAIASIASLRLDTAARRKSALAIFERHAPAVKLFRSKLVVLALDDKTFITAVTRKLADPRLADAFARELEADPGSVLRLEGTASVQGVIREALAADGGKLKATSEHLRRALRTQDRGPAPGDIAVGVGAAAFAGLSTGVLIAALLVCPPLGLALLPTTLAGSFLSAHATLVTALLGGTLVAGIFNLVGNIATEEGQDQVAACVARADAERDACLREAGRQPPGFKEAAELGCWAIWSGAAGICWVS